MLKPSVFHPPFQEIKALLLEVGTMENTAYNNFLKYKLIRLYINSLNHSTVKLQAAFLLLR